MKLLVILFTMKLLAQVITFKFQSHFTMMNVLNKKRYTWFYFHVHATSDINHLKVVMTSNCAKEIFFAVENEIFSL